MGIYYRKIIVVKQRSILQRPAEGQPYTIPLSRYGAAVGADIDRYLVGQEDWATLVGMIGKAFTIKIQNEIFSQMMNAYQQITPQQQFVGTGTLAANTKDAFDQIIANSYKKKVYIIGHKKPDFDSFFSAYLLSKILKSFNVDAIFAVRDEDFIDKKMINDWLDFKYEVVTDYSDKYFILVDHNNLDGIDKTHVLGAIDHHKITGEVSDLIEIEYASCALLIYDLFKSRYAFSFKEKKLIALSVLSDTEFLSSSRFSSEDKKLYDELDANIDVSQFKRKYLITTDFSMDINSNLFYDFKEYRVGRRIIKRSLIRSYSADKDKYYNLYVSAMKQYNVNLIIWCDYEKLVTYVRYNDIDIIYPYFTTSTNLIINYLVNEKYLKK